MAEDTFETVTLPDGRKVTRYKGAARQYRPAEVGKDPQEAFEARNIPIVSTVGSLFNAAAPAFDKYQKTGDFGKATQTYLQALADDTQRPGFGRDVSRLVLGGGRQLAQGIADFQQLGKDVSAGSANFPGLDAPLPRFTPKSPLEEVGQEIVGFIPALLTGTGIITGGTKVASKLPAAVNLSKTLLATNAAQKLQKGTQAVRALPGGTTAVNMGKRALVGAPAGAIADFIIYDADRAAEQANEWVKRNEHHFAEHALNGFVETRPEDSQALARLHNQWRGVLYGAGANELLFRGAQVVRRLNAIRKGSSPSTATPSQVDPNNPINPVTSGQTLDAERRAADPWFDFERQSDEQALEQARQVIGLDKDIRAVNRQLARMAKSVPDELGAVSVADNPLSKPIQRDVLELSPDQLELRPQEMQYKLAGLRNKTGNTKATRIDDWNENLAGIVSVVKERDTGAYVVANGHTRVNEAKRLGIDKVLARVVSDDLAEGRRIGALQNIAEGSGTAWDAAKLMRDGGMVADDLARSGIDLGGRIARDAVNLYRLPSDLFDAGVQGKLSLDKAIALGSVDGLDEVVIRDVAAAASKGKWSPDKIEQAMQEARFASVQAGTGVLPGFEDLMRSSNFADVLAVRTEAYKNLREQMIALTSAARASRTGILEAAGNVIDVAGSRAAKDQAAAALKLFNDVAGYVGPVRSLLTQMAEQVKGGASAKKVVNENLAALKEAIEAEVSGGKLPQAVDTASAGAVRELTEEQQRQFLGSVGRVEALKELDPERLAQEQRQAVETINRRHQETAERISTVNQTVSKQAVDDAERYGLNPRKVQTMMDMDGPAVAAEIDGYTKWILSQKQYGNRLAKLREYEKQYEAVRVFNDEMPGSNSGRELTQEEFDAKYGDQTPVVPKTADVNRVERDLNRHEEAAAVLEWHREWSVRPQSTAPRQPVALTPIEETKAQEEAVALVKKIEETASPQVRDETNRLIINALAGKPTPELRRALEQGLGGKTAQSATPAASFTFPGDLSKSAPRYGSATIEFASDLDRAAYMLRDVTKKSRGEDRLIAALEAAGYDIPAIRKHGAMVKEQIKTLVKDQTGSAAAPVGKQMALEVPDQGFNRGLSLGSELDSELASQGMSLDDLKQMVAAEKIKEQRTRMTAAQKQYDSYRVNNPEPANKDSKEWYEWFKGLQPLSSNYKREFDRLQQVIEAPLGEGTTFVPQAYGYNWRSVSPETLQAVSKIIAEDVRRVLGPEFAVRLEGLPYLAPKAVEWGGSGSKQEFGLVGGKFDPIEGVVYIYDMLGMAGGVKRKISTGYHEAWHAIQYNFLNENELRVLNSFYSLMRFDLSKRLGAKGLLEKQATAFERYAYAKDKGLPVAAFMLGVKESALKGQRVVNGVKVPLSGIEAGAMNVAVQAAKVFDDLVTWAERMHNYFVAQRGWTSTRDLFEAAYTGKLAKRGNLGPSVGEGFVPINERGRIVETIRYKEGISQGEGRRLDLFSEGDPPPPPRSNTPEANDGDPSDWPIRFARLREEYKDALDSGEISTYDLYKMNSFAKTQSPGGRPYTNRSEDLLAGLAAMSKVLPDRATLTGIPSQSEAGARERNIKWLAEHAGDDAQKIADGLSSLAKGFADYEHGALNLAMDYADKLMVRAEFEAAVWMQSAADSSISRPAQLARMIVAADSARRMHVAIANITRPWGQLGAEMQNKRDYAYGIDAAGRINPAGAIDVTATPVPNKPENIVNLALRKELELPPGSNPVTDELTDKFPELKEAIQTGQLTAEAEAVADEISDIVKVLGQSPGSRERMWRAWDSIPKQAEDSENALNALHIAHTSGLLMGGETINVNLMSGVFNTMLGIYEQGLGALVSKDYDRMLYAAQMFGGALTNLLNSFRIASIAFRTGKPTYNLGASSVDALNRKAAEDAQGQLLKENVENRRTGYTLNTLDMTEKFAATYQGKLLNGLWKAVTLGGRMSVTVDAFTSSMAGHTYEFFQHMPRGMELAQQAGLEKFSKEAFNYAHKYAGLRRDMRLKDIIIRGQTFTDAHLDSEYAQRFMNAVTFTDDIAAKLEPRSFYDGYRLGMAEGKKGQELNEYAQKYVDEGFWYHKLAEGFVTGGSISLPGGARIGSNFGPGRLASVPGVVLEGLGELQYVGPIFKFIQPFVRVVSNIPKEGLRRLPTSIFVDTWWRDITSADINTRQRAMGQWVSASSIAAAFFVGGTMGSLRMNGAGPIDPALKEQWLKERGGMNYSVQFWDDENNSWGPAVSLKAFSPITDVLAAIADFADNAAVLTVEQRNRAGGAIVLDILRMQLSGQLSKAYFQGIADFVEAVFDPSKVVTGPNQRDWLARWAQRIAVSMTFNIGGLRQARRAIDPAVRRVEPADSDSFLMNFWDETWQELKKDLPGLSEGQPAMLDWSAPGTPPIIMPQLFGSDWIRENAPFMLGLYQYTPVVGAFRRSAQLPNPVQSEMASMHGRGTVFSGPKSSDFGPEMNLTPIELSQYVKIFGEVKDPLTGMTWYESTEQMIRSKDYQLLPIEPPSGQSTSYRAAFIQGKISEYKALAKEKFLFTTPKGSDILKQQEALQGRQEYLNYIRNYGTPDVSRPSDRGATNFDLLDLNR